MIMADVSEFFAWADLVVKILALLALATGVFQLLEARRTRHVDMYWELVNRYLSPEGRAARRVMGEVAQALGSALPQPVEVADPARDAGFQRLAARYNEFFHDTDVQERKQVHPSVLYRLRYLNQAGVLLKKRLVDPDLLLGLIAGGVKIDRSVIDITLEAVRKHEGFRVYPYVEYVLNEVDKYIVRGGVQQGWLEKVGGRISSRRKRLPS
jgi:hypothetical protein